MLAFRRSAYDELLDHALAGTPEEVCGVLGGERDAATGGDDAAATVEVVRRAENVAADPRREYRIAPGELLALVEGVEESGREVVGFYHSHPAGPATPSPTDAERAAWPGHSYVVVALDGHPFVGSWRWTGEEFRREAVALG